MLAAISQDEDAWDRGLSASAELSAGEALLCAPEGVILTVKKAARRLHLLEQRSQGSQVSQG